MRRSSGWKNPACKPCTHSFGKFDFCSGNAVLVVTAGRRFSQSSQFLWSFRKSTSLVPPSRQGLANALASSIILLCKIIETDATETVAPQSFRDAFACHLYMLYSFMFFLESDVKGSTKIADDVLQMRQTCANAMVKAAETAAACRGML